MNKFLLFLTLYFYPFICFTHPWDNLTRTSTYVEYADGDGAVWDFGEAAVLRGSVYARIEAPGDTALAETYGALRLSYRLEQGRWSLCAEENRLARMETDCFLPWLDADSAYSCAYTAQGRYAWRTPYSHEGVAEVAAPQRGTLIMCDGDTVRGVTKRTLARRFSAVGDSACTYEIVYSRWEKAEDGWAMPLAFEATTRAIGPDGEQMEVSRTTYLRLLSAGESMALAPEEESVAEQPLPTLEEAQALLDHAEISTASGQITILLPECPGDWADMPLSASLVDASGHGYGQWEFATGDSPIAIDSTGLPHGQYLIIIAMPALEGTATIKRPLVVL